MQYQLVGADVTSANWLPGLNLPRNRATFVLFEGLTMYLQPAQGRNLIETLTGYFVGGGNQMAFDCVNWLTIASQRLEPMLAKTGSRFTWAVNEPRDMEDWHQGLRLRDEVLAVDNSENAKLHALARWIFWVCSWIPGLRTMGRYVRFEW
jgi:O-methyltransferase involved in polyketide biosynthesis